MRLLRNPALLEEIWTLGQPSGEHNLNFGNLKPGEFVFCWAFVTNTLHRSNAEQHECDTNCHTPSPMQEIPAAASQSNWTHPGIWDHHKMLMTWNALACVQSTLQTGKNHNLFQFSFWQYLSFHFLLPSIWMKVITITISENKHRLIYWSLHCKQRVQDRGMFFEIELAQLSFIPSLILFFFMLLQYVCSMWKWGCYGNYSLFFNSRLAT